MGRDASALDDLRAAVLAAPDDEAARLVYADALQVAGDPRGELISVQCELARLGCGRANQLFLEWVGDALADASAFGDGRVGKLRARESALVKKHGPALPELDQVTPRARSTGELARLLAKPDFLRARELYDVNGLGVAAYADAKLPALRRLLLNHTGGPHDLATLSRAKWLPQLTGLVLGAFSLGGSAADLAAILARTADLEELQLIDTRIGAAALASLTLPRKLRILALRHAKLGPGEAASILERVRSSDLAALDLRTNKLGPADLKALTSGFGALRQLSLEKCGVTDAMLATLSKSPLFGRLHGLDLRKNALTDAALPLLATAKALRVLHVGGNGLTPKGKKALQATKSLANARIYA